MFRKVDTQNYTIYHIVYDYPASVLQSCQVYMFLLLHAHVLVFKGTKWRSLSNLYILAPLSIAQVAESWKLNGVPLLSMSPCLHCTRTSGDLVSHWKPSSGSTIRAFSQYFSMVLRYGVWPLPYRRR